MLALVLAMTTLINNPHFMHSYQIFYSDFGSKTAPEAPLRWRYLVAGVGVPVIAVIFYLWCIVTLNVGLMAQAANVMLFLVGWHYVKQGYGILIVESVLKRAFFSDPEKRLLRWNALSVWLASWMYFNRLLGEFEIYGFTYYAISVPDAVYLPTLVFCVGAGVLTAGMLIRKALKTRLPLNGLLAYATSSYVWLIIGYVHPLTALVIPAFHSLQYLAIVWRYQLNKNEYDADGDGSLFGGLVRTTPARAATLKFILLGMVLGVIFFYAIPFALDLAIAYREEVFGTTMFLFAIWVFINIHHYFMDNVIWRRDNPTIKEHLFS
ncbi:hypothetical protein EI983_18860 [Roseovarius faecimaris]|uniref:Uncharacterized protein n=1 Tax=Roseovarius faecimaris TaxID=2494550 RepID=A0A6I6IVK8_9RHOB|nr:hypothetical protein [Roseovarius faecimaris]QGY00213.1 hypothetical protein EI983_18860 [Roseovarius faecimaris]